MWVRLVPSLLVVVVLWDETTFRYILVLLVDCTVVEYVILSHVEQVLQNVHN